MAKTNGDPFFVHQFIKTLCQEGLIRNAAEEKRWHWDEDDISRAEITNNVVELLCLKIRQLSGASQQALTAAACFGNTFEVDVLARVCELPKHEVLAALMPPLKEGLLRPRDMSYKYLDLGEEAEPGADALPPAAGGSRFSFVHDRVQQAAYSLLSDAEPDRLHLAIGRIMLHDLTKAQDESELLFQTLDHLTPRFHLLTNPAEQSLLAGYTLQAAHKALATMAAKTARQCASDGARILGSKGWSDYYELCRDLHRCWAESAYLTGLFDEAEETLATFLVQGSIRRRKEPKDTASRLSSTAISIG